MPVCIDTGDNAGFCTKTISNEESYPEGKDWTAIKENALVMPLESWKEIKIFILNICRDYGKCVEADEKIKSIEREAPQLQK